MATFLNPYAWFWWGFKCDIALKLRHTMNMETIFLFWREGFLIQIQFVKKIDILTRDISISIRYLVHSDWQWSLLSKLFYSLPCDVIPGVIFYFLEFQLILLDRITTKLKGEFQICIFSATISVLFKPRDIKIVTVRFSGLHICYTTMLVGLFGDIEQNSL